MKPFDPKSAHVLSELLGVGFRAYPRNLINGVVFAAIAGWFLRDTLPRSFIVLWLLALAGLNLARYSMSREFLRSPPAPESMGRWGRRAATGQGLSGLAWGILGAAVIGHAPQAFEAVLIIFFTISLFVTFNAAGPASYPPIFNAFLFCAMVPMLLLAGMQPGDAYRYLFLTGVLFMIAAALIGSNTNRYIIESIRMRYENVELLHDLIEQKDELDKANRAKTHFLAAASHDLRQPMQAVVLLVESLQERVREPEERRIAESIRSSVASMAALLNAILDVSRFDAGTVKPERAHFPVGRVLDRLRTAFTAEAAQRRLTLHVLPSSAVVDSDPILLYRVLANIVTNALRYTPRGRITIGCRRRRGTIEVQVWDTGIGIPEENLDDVFREFYQLGNPQRDREQGLGLGLAIVERTARLLGHAVKVRSRPGVGSMFSVAVPIGDAAAVRKPALEERGTWVPLLGCKVLVVEDERDIRAAMTTLLEGWGCHVLTAASGPEAHALLAGTSDAPDVVFADYRLPGGEDGIVLLESLVQAHPSASAILISGDIEPELLKRARDAGLTLLHKPVRPARLRALLGSVWRERAGAVA
jgi:signal transduction histidine kinase